MMMMRRRMRMRMMMMTHCHHHQFGLPHFSVHNRKSSAQAIFCIMIIAAIHGSDYLLVFSFSFFQPVQPFSRAERVLINSASDLFHLFPTAPLLLRHHKLISKQSFRGQDNQMLVLFVFWGFTFCNWHIKWASLLQSTRSHICFLECHRFLITYWQISLQLFGLFFL